MAYPATPKTWVAGDVLTAAQLNAELRDALLGAFPLGPPDTAWVSWSPTLANLTLGNGAIVSKYQRIGRTIHWRFKFTLGSTSAVGTTPSFTLPVAPHADYFNGTDIPGILTCHDNGTADFNGVVRMSTGSIVILLVSGVAGTYDSQTGLSATVPFTWTTADALAAYGTYEAAT